MEGDAEEANKEAATGIRQIKELTGLSIEHLRKVLSARQGAALNEDFAISKGMLEALLKRGDLKLQRVMRNCLFAAFTVLYSIYDPLQGYDVNVVPQFAEKWEMMKMGAPASPTKRRKQRAPAYDWRRNTIGMEELKAFATSGTTDGSRHAFTLDEDELDVLVLRVYAGEHNLSYLSEEARRLAPLPQAKESALATSIRNWWKSDAREGGKRYRGISEKWDTNGMERDSNNTL